MYNTYPKYTSAQFQQIKARSPKCIYPKHCKDGTISYMVRVTTYGDNKLTLITTRDIVEAMNTINEYNKKKAERRNASSLQSVESILGIMEQVFIPDNINEYLSSLPPHEITATSPIIISLDDGKTLTSISPEIQAEFLRRTLGINSEIREDCPAPVEANGIIELTNTQDNNSDGPTDDRFKDLF